MEGGHDLAQRGRHSSRRSRRDALWWQPTAPRAQLVASRGRGRTRSRRQCVVRAGESTKLRARAARLRARSRASPPARDGRRCIRRLWRDGDPARGRRRARHRHRGRSRSGGACAATLAPSDGSRPSRRESRTSLDRCAARRRRARSIRRAPDSHERVSAVSPSATPAPPRAIDLRELRPGHARARPRSAAALSHRVAPRVRHVSADRARRDGLRARSREGETHEVLRSDRRRGPRGPARRRRRPPRRRDVAAHVASIDGTPVRMVTIGDAVHRVVVRPGARRAATYTLWLDGYRFDVEALDERTRAIRELSGKSAEPPGRRRSSRRCRGSSSASTRSRAIRCRRGRDSSSWKR